MKTKTIIAIAIISIFTFVLTAEVQNQPEENENNSRQTVLKSKAWENLSQIEILKTLNIKETVKGKVWQFDLNNIKQALVKAQIQEPVTIEYVSVKGIVYNLGTYAPALKQKVTIENKNNRRYINPQPEPPGFPSIPSIKQVAQNSAILLKDAQWKNKSVILFKNSTGQVKAAVEITAPIFSSIEPVKKDLSNNH